jgi:hypothetical protein
MGGMGLAVATSISFRSTRQVTRTDKSGAFLRLLPLILATATALAPTIGAAQETSQVAGRVVDTSSAVPIPGVIVQISEGSQELTDENGVFRFERVPVGIHSLSFEHIAYGTQSRPVEVVEGDETLVLVRISAQAIELTPLLVEALSELEARRRTSGNSINEVTANRIDLAARSGLTLGQFISALPGVDARPSGLGLCVTYRAIRSDNDLGDCNGVSVVLDGVAISDPAYIYNALPLQDIERLEVLSPAQAGVRYGPRSGQGVLLIETKTAQTRRKSDLSKYLTGMDWTQESQPYPWFNVLASTFVTNAASLGVTYLLSDRCFVTQESSLAIRTRCGGLSTAGTAILSVALPATTSGLIARRVGTTDRSRGRLVPSMISAGIGLTAGYIMFLASANESRAAGVVVLALGVPIAVTLSDRLIRILR